jgi:hypothetical protein
MRDAFEHNPKFKQEIKCFGEVNFQHYNYMESELSKFLLQDILPNILYRYITADYYPVIVGGTDLNRCANVDFAPVTDIDVKFIATHGEANEYEIVFARGECMDMILEMYHAKKPTSYPNLVKGKVNTKYSYRQAIHVEGDTKLVVVDTAVIGPRKEFMLQYKYINYAKWLKTHDENVLVPFKLIDNLPWADCSWVYIDTVRMVMVTLQEYSITTVKSQKQYLIAKAIKYIGKLAHLEVYYKKHTDVKALLVKAKNALLNVGDGDKLVASLMVVLDRKTDYTKISKILKAAELVTHDLEYFRKSIALLVHNVPSPQKNAIIRVWFGNNERFKKGGYTLSIAKDNVIINNIFSFRK